MALTDGLKAFWKLDGNGNDSSGNNNHGTPSYMSYTTGDQGRLVGDFSGPGNNASRIKIPESILGGASEISIYARFKTTRKPNLVATGDRNGIIRDRPSNFVFSVSYGETNSSRGPEFAITNEAGTLKSVHHGNINIINLNQWYVMTGTYDGTMMRLYLDGVLVGTTSQSGKVKSTPDNTSYIGIDGNNVNWAYKGLIDGIGLWDRALSPQEIQTLYNNGNGLTYPFNEITETKPTQRRRLL